MSSPRTKSVMRSGSPGALSATSEKMKLSAPLPPVSVSGPARRSGRRCPPPPLSESSPIMPHSVFCRRCPRWCRRSGCRPRPRCSTTRSVPSPPVMVPRSSRHDHRVRRVDRQQPVLVEPAIQRVVALPAEKEVLAAAARQAVVAPAPHQVVAAVAAGHGLRSAPSRGWCRCRCRPAPARCRRRRPRRWRWSAAGATGRARTRHSPTGRAGRRPARPAPSRGRRRSARWCRRSTPPRSCRRPRRRRGCPASALPQRLSAPSPPSSVSAPKSPSSVSSPSRPTRLSAPMVAGQDVRASLPASVSARPCRPCPRCPGSRTVPAKPGIRMTPVAKSMLTPTGRRHPVQEVRALAAVELQRALDRGEHGGVVAVAADEGVVARPERKMSLPSPPSTRSLPARRSTSLPMPPSSLSFSVAAIQRVVAFAALSVSLPIWP